MSAQCDEKISIELMTSCKYLLVRGAETISVVLEALSRAKVNICLTEKNFIMINSLRYLNLYVGICIIKKNKCDQICPSFLFYPSGLLA